MNKKEEACEWNETYLLPVKAPLFECAVRPLIDISLRTMLRFLRHFLLRNVGCFAAFIIMDEHLH